MVGVYVDAVYYIIEAPSRGLAVSVNVREVYGMINYPELANAFAEYIIMRTFNCDMASNKSHSHRQ